MSIKPILQARGLVKSFRKNQLEVPVLRGVDLDIMPGLITAMVGRSGSGKSTLMHLMATLDQPDQGTVSYYGHRLDNAPKKQREYFRNHDIGIIFQFYHLMPELSAIENVLMPIMIRSDAWSYFKNRKKYRQRAEALLDRVGLAHRAQHKPTEMSGGEMQRAAIARALISDPSILLADEPTGNLDGQTGRDILTLLKDLNRLDGLTIIMVTHDSSIARAADRTVRLENGRIVTDLDVPKADSPVVAA